MAQFLRPDGDVTTTNITNGYAQIDEVSMTVDKLYSANGSNATYECTLSNPAGAPNAGTTTVRYTASKWDSSIDDPAPNSGRNVILTCHVYQGSTLIASDTPRTMSSSGSGLPTDFSFTPNMAGVTDWNNLRLRFTSTMSGSGNTYGFALRWAEMEVPDSFVSLTGNEITSGAALIDSPALTQLHILAGNEITGGAPLMDSPTATNTTPLAATDVALAAPMLDSPALTQVQILAANDVLGGAPIIDTPALVRIPSPPAWRRLTTEAQDRSATAETQVRLAETIPQDRAATAT